MKKKKPPKNNFNLESLEKRILLSADLIPFAGISTAADTAHSFEKDISQKPAVQNSIIAEYDRESGSFDSSFSANAASIRVQKVSDLAESSVSSALRQKTDVLRDKLKSIGLSFDLKDLSLPVLPSKLDTMFGLSDHIEAFKDQLLPKIEAADNMTDLVTQLQGKGFQVLGVKDGLSALGIDATSDGSYIHLKFSASLSEKLSLKNEYQGDTFNNESQSLLQSLASSVNLESGSDFLSSLTAGVSIDLELKLNDSGLMVLAGSAVKADLNVSGAVTGSASTTSHGSLDVSGTASADIDIALNINTSNTGIYVQDIASDPAGSFAATATGEANVKLDLAYKSMNLGFTADYTLSSNLLTFATDQNVDLALTGKINVPGLKTADAQASTAYIDFTGTYDLNQNQWDLTANADNLRFMEMEFKDISGTLTIKDSSVSGSITGDIYLDFLSSSTNTVKSSVNLIFTDTGFTLTDNTSLDNITIKEPGSATDKIFISAGSTVIDFDISAVFDTSSITGTISFTADSANLLPGKTEFTAGITDDITTDTLPAINGVMDISERDISFSCRHLEITSANKFNVTADDITLNLDLDAVGQQTLVTIADAEIKLLGFSGTEKPGLTLKEFKLFTDGFSFTNMTGSLPNGFKIGSFLTAGASVLSLTDVKYHFDTGLSGTMDFKVSDDVTLLPNLSGFTAKVYDQENTAATGDTDDYAITGHLNMATGKFEIDTDAFELKVDKVFSIDGFGGKIAFDPTLSASTEQDLFTLDSFKIEIDPLKINNQALTSSGTGLTVSTHGFKLADLVIPEAGTKLGTVKIGSTDSQGSDADPFVSITDPNLELKNIKADSSGVSGTITFTADQAALLPDKTEFSSSITDDITTDAIPALKGVIDIAELDISFSCRHLEITSANKFNVTADDITLNLDLDAVGQQTLVTIADAEIKLLGFSGTEKPGFTLKEFKLFTDGFSFTNMTGSLPNGFKIGSFLTAGASVLSLTDVKYHFDTGLSGTMDFKVSDDVTLLPNLSGFTAKVYDQENTAATGDTDDYAITGHLNMATGKFEIDTDAFELKVDKVFSIDGFGGKIAFDPTLSASTEQDLFTLDSFKIEIDPLKINNQALTSSGTGLTVSTHGFKLADLVIPEAGHSFGTITIHEGSNKIISIDNPGIEFKGVSAYSDGLKGSVILTAGTAVLFPDNSGSLIKSSISDLDGDDIAIRGEFKFSNKGLDDFSLSLDKVDFSVEKAFSFSMEKAVLSPFDKVVFIAEGAITADVEKFGVSGSIIGLEIGSDGSVCASDFKIDTTELNHNFHLANFLPVVINSAEFKFLGDTNNNGIKDAGETFDISNFEFDLTGTFNFELIKKHLLFDPYVILHSGNDYSSGTKVTGDQAFSFGIRLVDGDFTPWTIPGITLGIESLKIGNLAEVKGEITLGGFENGQWTDHVGGQLTILHNSHMKNIKKSDTVSGTSIAALDEGFTIEIDNSSTFDIKTGVIDLKAVFGISFALGDYIDVKDCELDFNFKATYDISNQLSPSFTLNKLGLSGSSFESVKIKLKNWVEIEADNGSLDFNPSAGENIADFGKLIVAVPEFGLSGAVENISITASGDLYVGDHLEIALKATDKLLSHIKWPKWLPVQLDSFSVAIKWPDFNSSPEDFTVNLSTGTFKVSMPGTNNQVSLSGALNGLEITVDGTSTNIDSISEFKISITGNLGAADLDASVDIGLLKLDSEGEILNGKIVDENGNILFEKDIDGQVEKRVLYGIVQGGLVIEGYGFEFRMGLCDYGPVAGYVYLGAPLDIGLATGIGIHELTAQVRFDPQDTKGITKAEDLENLVLPKDQTPDQWGNAVMDSIKDLAKADAQGENPFAKMLNDISIEGSITFYDLYTEDLIQLTGDVRLDTAGKLMVTGELNITDYANAGIHLYIDLSQIEPTQLDKPQKGSFMAYVFLPQSQELTKPPMSIFGDLSIEGDAVKREIQLTMDGGVKFSLDGMFQISIAGSSDLKFSDKTPTTPEQLSLDLDGAVNITGIGNALGLAGKLDMVFDASNNMTYWGGLVMKPKSFSALESLGIKEDVIAVYRVNSANHEKSVSLSVPGQPDNVKYVLPAASAGMLIEGIIVVKEAGKDWFGLHGSLSTFQKGTHCDSVFDGQLVIGPASSLTDADAKDAWIVFDTLGYMRFDLEGIAAELDLKISEGGALKSSISKYFDLTGTFRLQVNATEKRVIYDIPTLYGGQAGGERITLEAGAPDIISGTVSADPSPWALVSASNAKLEIDENFVVTGDFGIVVSTEHTQIVTKGNLRVGSADDTIFNLDVNGIYQGDSNGMAGVFKVDLDTFHDKDKTFSLSGEAHFVVNSTGSEVTLENDLFDKPFVIPAGDNNTVYARILAKGPLKINKPFETALVIDGTYEFELVSNLSGPGYYLKLTSNAVTSVAMPGDPSKALFSFRSQFMGMVNDTGLFALIEYSDPDYTDNYDKSSNDSIRTSDGGYGYSFSKASISINTTANDIQALTSPDGITLNVLQPGENPDSGIIIPSLVGADIDATGFISLFDDFIFSGEFDFKIDDNHWTIALDADLVVRAEQIKAGKLFEIPFKRIIHLDLPGIVINESFSLDKGWTKLENFDISGDFSVKINTTKDAAPAFGLDAGPYAKLHFENGDIRINGFKLTGDFSFISNALSSLSASGDFDLDLDLFDENLFHASGSGALHFGFDGFAAKLDLTTPVIAGFELQELSQHNEKFCYIDINTSSSDFKIELDGKTYILTKGPYALVNIHAGLGITGFSDIGFQGDFTYDSQGGLSIDAKAWGKLFNHEFASFEVIGIISATSKGKYGKLDIKEDAKPAFDLPESWGFSLGSKKSEIFFEINLPKSSNDDKQDDKSNISTSTDSGITEDLTKEFVSISVTSEFHMALVQIKGTAAFKWVKGEEFMIALGGYSWLGFGERDNTGKPSYSLLGFTVGGEIGITDHGVFGGIEAKAALGTKNIGLLESMGFDLGFDNSVQAYLRINTTGKEQDCPGLPGKLGKLEAGKYGEFYFEGEQKLASLLLEGAFGFRIQKDGIRIIIDADVDASILKSSEHSQDHAEQLTIFTYEFDGFAQITSEGVLAFVDAEYDFAHIELLGATGLDIAHTQGYVRINTTGKAVNVRDIMPDLPNDIPSELLSMPAGKYGQAFMKISYALQGLTASGWAGVEISHGGLTFFGNLTTKFSLIHSNVVNLEFFEIKNDVFLYFSEHGIAGGFVTIADPFKFEISHGFDFSSPEETAVIINTTGKALNLTEYMPSMFSKDFEKYADLKAGKYAEIITNTTINEMVSAADTGFKMTGPVRMWVDAENKCIAAENESTMEVDFLGLEKQKFTVSGSFVITEHGIALTQKAETETSTFKIMGTNTSLSGSDVYLTINTTGRDIDTLGLKIAGRGKGYAELTLHAVNELFGAGFKGNYTLLLEKDQLRLRGDVSFDVLGHTLSQEKIDFILTEHGMAAKAVLKNNAIAVPGHLDIKGTYTFMVNTASRHLLGISPESMKLSAKDVNINLAGVSVSGDCDIVYSDSKYSITVPSTHPLHYSGGGISFSVYGHIDKHSFSLYGKAGARWGDRAVADLDGYAEVHIKHTGFTAHVSGALYILGHKTDFSVKENVSLDNFRFDFHVHPSLVLPGALNFVKLHSGGGFKGYISNKGVVIEDASAQVVVHKIGFSDQISGKLNSITKSWSFSGKTSLHKNEYGINLDLSIDFDLTSSGRTKVHAHASVSKRIRLGWWHHHWHHTYSASASGDITAHNVSLSGHISIPGPDIHFHINLNGGSLLKTSDIAGFTIFFDSNNNGIKDESEFQTVADEMGYFSFDNRTLDDYAGSDTSELLLGSLEAFDTDSSSTLDLSEGVFVIKGGYDIHSGLENTITYIVSASDYGSLIAPVSSSLSNLHYHLMTQGLDSESAWRYLKAGFGINFGGDLAHFDPNLSESLGSESAHLDIEAAYMRIGLYLVNGAQALKSVINAQYSDKSIDDSKIFQSLLSALAAKIKTIDHVAAELDIYVDENDNLIDIDPLVDLNDSEVFAGLLQAAGTSLISGFNPSGDVLKASAHIFNVQMTYSEKLTDTGVKNITEALSRIKFSSARRATADYADIISGAKNLDQVISSYSRTELIEDLSKLDLPYDNQAPELSGLPETFKEHRDKTDLTVNVSDPDGLAEDVKLTIESSDSRIVASEDITLNGTGSKRDIMFNRKTDFAGLTRITLTGDDGFSENNISQLTFDFISMADLALTGGYELVYENGAVYAELPFKINVPSNLPITLECQISGEGADDVHVQAGIYRAIINAGETESKLRIRVMSSSFEKGLSINIMPLNSDYAVILNPSVSVDMDIPVLPAAAYVSGRGMLESGSLMFSDRISESTNVSGSSLFKALHDKTSFENDMDKEFDNIEDANTSDYSNRPDTGIEEDFASTQEEYRREGL